MQGDGIWLPWFQLKNYNNTKTVILLLWLCVRHCTYRIGKGVAVVDDVHEDCIEMIFIVNTSGSDGAESKIENHSQAKAAGIFLCKWQEFFSLVRNIIFLFTRNSVLLLFVRFLLWRKPTCDSIKISKRLCFSKPRLKLRYRKSHSTIKALETCVRT